MTTRCPVACDHDADGPTCQVCGWTSETSRPSIPHPDDMPTATGPDRVAQAIARDRGGWAPQSRVTFAKEDSTR